MIGIMILTVAIVSATNLLVGLIGMNKVNVQTLQAYYFAQEGLEAIRNIRDTNWLHNSDYNGAGVYPELKKGSVYAVFLNRVGWEMSGNAVQVGSKDELKNYAPWDVAGPFGQQDVYNSVFALKAEGEAGNKFYSGGGGEGGMFFRYIEILPPPQSTCDPVGAINCDDFMLVRCVVNWKNGNDDRQVVLEEILSNWKGGAL